MTRKPCYVGEGLKKGAWTTEEDKKLISYIQEHGEGGWRDIPQKAGLKRCGKSCRLRWANYLKPEIKRGEFSYEEEQIVIMLHASRGNKWSVIARHLPKRTDNEIKNYWNTILKKRLIDQGIDPVTHKPVASSSPNPTTPKISDFQDDSSNPRSKKLCFKRLSSTSKVLNKVAARASSMRKILSASMEGTLMSSTTLSKSLTDELSETSQFQMEEFDPFSHSSELILDHMKEDIGMNFNLINNADYNFSQFLEQFCQNKGEEAEQIGGYNQDLFMPDVSSETIGADDMMRNITAWSDYPVENSDFSYDTNQDYDDKNFI